jgi:hypothetical protein
LRIDTLVSVKVLIFIEIKDSIELPVHLYIGYANKARWRGQRRQPGDVNSWGIIRIY